MSYFLSQDKAFEEVITPYNTPLVLDILPDIRKAYGHNTVLKAELDEDAKAFAQQLGFRSPESPSSRARRRSKSRSFKRKRIVRSSLPSI